VTRVVEDRKPDFDSFGTIWKCRTWVLKGEEQKEKDEPEEVVVEEEEEERIYHVLKGFGCLWKGLGFGAVGESLH
jgi:hypothetical protein